MLGRLFNHLFEERAEDFFKGVAAIAWKGNYLKIKTLATLGAILLIGLGELMMTSNIFPLLKLI